MRTIILVFDQVDIKIEENQMLNCFCARRNSVDRAKILIKYLRTKLLFKKDQIIFLRTSHFSSASQLLEKLKAVVDRYQYEDLIFYYSGHGIAPIFSGWFSEDPIFLFRIIKRFFGNFI